MPSVAIREPLGLSLRILEMRSYAQTYRDRARWEMAGDDEDVELEITDTLRLLWKVEALRAASRRET